ncbi:MAG: c-type cytochrome [Pseudomonadota bacterium]
MRRPQQRWSVRSSGSAWTLLLGVLTLAACAPVEQPTGPGATTYLRYCYSCHAAGIAGAPRVGSAEQWRARAAQGLDVLLAHTLAGIDPGMPEKGGCRECSDAELVAAIEHMLAASGLSYGADGSVEASAP